MEEKINKMMLLIEDHLEFSIGDEVYHKTESEARGIVASYRIFGHDKSVQYFISWGPGSTTWEDDRFLTAIKPTVY